MSSAADRIEAESHKDPERLEREIDQQRAQIDRIVDALENRLSPGQLFDRVLEFGKGNGRELADNFGTTIKAHPVPALLTAVGLAWLYASRNEPAPRSPGRVPSRADGPGDEAGALADQAGDAMDRARTMGEDLGGSVAEGWHEARAHVADARARLSDGIHHAGETLAGQKDRVMLGYHRMLEENPLALGAMGIAVGALLGAALPRTRTEDRVMGEARDDLVDKARDTLQAGAQKTRETVHEMGEPDRGVRH